MLFRARLHSFARLYDEAAELVAVNFGEDYEEVREARVADPHLLAVQDVELSVFAKARSGFRR